MPIALFPALVSSLTKVGKSMTPWNRLALIEEQILRRARAAFLVQWFGTGVPVRRLNLLIHIVNIEALKARYALVRRSMPRRLPGMSLMGPLAMMAGMVIGMFMSPVGSILFMPHLHDTLGTLLGGKWYEVPLTLLYSLVLNWIMPVLGPGVAVGVGLPLGLGLAFGAALGGDRLTRAFAELMGDAAMMIDAFLNFWRQISDPDVPIRNPVVAAIVRFLDRFAAFSAQLLGFVAIVVVRLVPILPYLINQFRALFDLGSEVADTVRDTLSGIRDALQSPFQQGGGIKRILVSVLDAVKALPGRLLGHINDVIADIVTEFGYVSDAIGRLLSDYITGLLDRIVEAFLRTPVGTLVFRLTNLLGLVPRIEREFRSIMAETSPGSGGADEGTDWAELDEKLRGSSVNALGRGIPGAAADLLQAARQLDLPAPPTLDFPPIPDLPTLPDIPALRSEIGLPGPIDFGAEATRLLQRARAATERAGVPAALLRRPASLFAAQRAELARLWPREQTARDHQLRDAIFLAVGRVLPAALRPYTARVRAVFQQIDELLYGIETEEDSDWQPQRELVGSGRLRPVVGVLAFRSTGGFAPDLRAFRDLTVEAIQAETYRVAEAN